MKKNIRHAQKSKAFDDNKSNIEVLNFFQNASEHDLEVVYAAGYSMFIQKEYKKALRVFKLLSIVKKNNVKYWHALANTQLALEYYEDALESYLWAIDLNPQDIRLQLLCIKCAIKLKNIILAEKFLKSAQELAQNSKNASNYQLIVDNQVNYLNQIKGTKEHEKNN